MDKFLLVEKIKNSKPIDREAFIQEICRDKRVLDLGCIQHNAEFALKNRRWLHKIIRSTAKETVGVDYLPDEIRKLKSAGYDIVFGDVTKPLGLSGQFDVIVAADIIEHLTNFDGFFDNCRRFLKPGGILVITTANPFYSELFHYLALKKNFFVNPEHTCWIDPYSLAQMSERFRFRIEDIHFIKNSWGMGNIICETRSRRYDICRDEWAHDSLMFKIYRSIVWAVFNIFYVPYKILTGTGSVLVRHSDYLATLKPE